MIASPCTAPSTPSGTSSILTGGRQHRGRFIVTLAQRGCEQTEALASYSFYLRLITAFVPQQLGKAGSIRSSRSFHKPKRPNRGDCECKDNHDRKHSCSENGLHKCLPRCAMRHRGNPGAHAGKSKLPINQSFRVQRHRTAKAKRPPPRVKRRRPAGRNTTRVVYGEAETLAQQRERHASADQRDGEQRDRKLPVWLRRHLTQAPRHPDAFSCTACRADRKWKPNRVTTR